MGAPGHLCASSDQGVVQIRDLVHECIEAQTGGHGGEHALAEARALSRIGQQLFEVDEKGFEASERFGVGENLGGQDVPVDSAALDDAGKSCPHGFHRLTLVPQHAVDGGIGVVDRHAEAAEDPGGGRLAHADGTRQAQDNHYSPSRTWALSASVTRGSTPNQAAKPGRA